MPDPDFGFSKITVEPKETAWLALPELHGEHALQGYFAGHDDSSYTKAKLKQPSAAGMSSDELVDNERRLFARHVLCGWKGFKTRDQDGVERVLDFSEGLALAMLRQIPTDVLVKILRFFTTRENFVVAREREAARRELEGNSPAGSSGS